jgi:multiple sugar transport system ATP-binding protein
MVAGLEEISDGTVRIGDRVVNGLTPKSRDIAMVFQSYALYPHLTVRDNIAFPLKLARLSKDEIASRIGGAAHTLDLEPYLERKPRALSGGQRQRVAMGRAIVREPKAFLMDEPLSNLDAKLRVQMRTQVSRIQQQLGTTTVYVTHDQTEAMTLGDRVAVMRAGIIQQVDTPKALYEDPANLFVAGFIGSPSMNFLPARLEGDRVRLPFGDAPLTDELRSKLQSAEGGHGAKDVIAGIRPEHFEDAAIEDSDLPNRIKFRAKIDVVESMGSELYAYFDVKSETIHSGELEELAKDAGMEDLPHAGQEGAQQVIARLDAASKASPGGEVELVLNAEEIKLFDPAGGRSLTVSKQAAAA